MRILILAGWYPNLENPMKGIFVREQALALAKAGLPVAVFYPFDEAIKSGEMKYQIEESIPVYRANTLGCRNRYLARVVSYYTANRRLAEVVKLYQPDIIHVHVGYPAGIVAYLFTRHHKIPYVITEHMSYLQDYVAKWQHRILLKPTFEQAAYVLPVSQALAEQIESFGWKVKLKPVPNVVDTERFTPLSPGAQTKSPTVKEQGEGSGMIRILFAGNMEETQIKGVQYLLPAFAQVCKEASQRMFHLDLVGEGGKRATYEEMTKHLGISDCCTFHGRVDPRDMPELYRRSDFVILPSLKETFGCVLIEALATGKPVLATNCGGPQSIVNEKVGLLVQPGSIKDLVEGIQKMLIRLDQDQYQATELREYALTHYSGQALAGMLKEIYGQVVENP
ncbi:Glycoside hydrolase [Candidatus Desulfosporosinus infrequens]|uniref:Glycoside hydrolase n=1 Tax=Candidatus Desulfosporosinus infrequens TaxID=2043169 RepID=A0A2U3KYZ1_9FIRM|nr:Glycoside hydrolase [Candidatus Desulfosporosinus infrequens]